MRREALAVLTMVLLAAAAGAQDPVREEEAVEEQAEPQERRPLRVLDNPYDISSFYRSAEGGYFWGPGYGPMGGPGYPANGSERYPIAGYYRSRQGGYYAPFWTGGYGYGYGGHGHGNGNLGFGFRRRIGENGDLFLFAPAFLAPVGPLSGIFFSQPPK